MCTCPDCNASSAISKLHIQRKFHSQQRRALHETTTDTMDNLSLTILQQVVLARALDCMQTAGVLNRESVQLKLLKLSTALAKHLEECWCAVRKS
jgi:hypothetical protein